MRLSANLAVSEKMPRLIEPMLAALGDGVAEARGGFFF